MPSPKRLRILLVGASGTIGGFVQKELSARHDIITAGKKSGDIRIDMQDTESIVSSLKNIENIDAVVVAAGHVTFRPLAQFKPAAIGESLHTLGLQEKLMGQVNIALAARDVLNDGGSITLTSGILAEQYIAGGSSAAMINGAIENFVRASAIEMPRGIRINAVSPSVLLESMDKYAASFRGFEPVPGARAALGYSRSVEGMETGKVYKVF